MDKIGLTYEQINDILLTSLAPELPVSVVGLRDVIATAIVKNNEKLLEDINKLLSTK